MTKVRGKLVNRDGQETIEIPGLPPIPVLGVVNCTGKPLPEARETAKRIEEFFRHSGGSRNPGGTGK